MLADVDAPSVLTAAKAGTDFGYAILLPVIALIPVLYLVQEMTARLAIGTGLGHAELIRERYGFHWGAIALVSMVVIDLLAYTAQFAGIVLGASLIGIGAVPAVLGALVIHSLIVLTRGYRQFEVVAIGLSLALFAFVVLAVTTGPDLRSVLGGLSPILPFDRPGYLDLVVATIGAVVMPWMLFYQQAATTAARALLDELLGELAPGTAVHEVDATDPEVARRQRFPGSPTIRIDGLDVDPSYRDPGDYTPRCRLYRTADGLRGLPERSWVEAAILRSLDRDGQGRR